MEPKSSTTTNPLAVLPERILRSAEVCAMLGGIAGSTLWVWVRKGEFPAPIRLAPTVVGWRLSRVLAWIGSREAAPPPAKRTPRSPGRYGGRAQRTKPEAAA